MRTMKRYTRKWIALTVVILAVGGFLRTNAQIGLAEVIRAGIKRVVRAVDLKVQRLQNRTIWLQNAQKVLENSLSRLRLQEISEWTQRHTEQYQDHYQQFSKVRSAIANFQQVRQMIRLQLGLVREYQRVWELLKGDPVFSSEEIGHMEKVYAGILDRSISNLDQIRTVMMSFHLAMTDRQRMELINNVGSDIYRNYMDLVGFNRQNLILRTQRAGERERIENIKKLYNIQ